MAPSRWPLQELLISEPVFFAATLGDRNQPPPDRSCRTQRLSGKWQPVHMTSYWHGFPHLKLHFLLWPLAVDHQSNCPASGAWWESGSKNLTDPAKKSLLWSWTSQSVQTLPVPVAWSTKSRLVGLSGCSRNAAASSKSTNSGHQFGFVSKTFHHVASLQVAVAGFMNTTLGIPRNCGVLQSWCNRICSPANGLSELPKAALASVVCKSISFGSSRFKQTQGPTSG